MAEDQAVVEQTPEQIQADSSAAFERGFNTERGTPPPVETPKVEAAPAGEQAVADAEPVAEAQPDPWEGVPPAVKARLEAQDARLAAFDKVPDRLRNIEGHIGGLTSQLKAAAAARVAVEKSGVAAPSQAQVAQAQTSEKWKQLKEDYPDWADAMDERLAAINPTQPAVDVEARLAAQKAEIEAAAEKKIEEAKTTARQFARVDAKYEDWETTVQSTEFKAWFGKQAPEVQALAESTAAKDAIALLDRYTAAAQAAKKAAEQEAAKKKRLESAMTPKGVAASPDVLNDADAFDRGFAKVRG